MARDLQESVDDVVREAELEDIKNTIADADLTQNIKDATDLDFDDFDLDGDVRDEMTAAADDLKAITDPGASKKSKAKKTPAKKTKAKKTAKKTTAAKKAKATKKTKADG